MLPNTRYRVAVQLGCKAVGIPEPIAEHRFSPPRKFRFDWCWEAQKVALEVQGAIWTQGRHSRGSGLLREHEKLNLAASQGWKVSELWS